MNSKVLGMFKDVCAGTPMTEFVALRPKFYAFKVGARESKRAKGVKKSIVKNEMTFADYKACLHLHRADHEHDSEPWPSDLHILVSQESPLSL